MAEANGGELTYQIKVDSKDADKNLKQTSKNIENLGESAEKSEGKTSKALEGIKKAITAAAIGAALIKVTKEIANATAEAERASAIIAKGTGAVGESLKELNNSANTVYGQTARAREDIANGIAEVNTRFKLVGEELKKTTKQLSDFADIAGTDVKTSVANISKTMQRWNLDLKEMPSLLDKITASAQASGIDINTLNESLIANAGTLQTMGYSLDESIAMLSQFESAGLSSQSVLMAMKKSFEDSAQAGTNAREDWQKLIDEIQDATDSTTANAKAVKVFGARVGTEMVTAIRKGSLSFKDFEKVVKNSVGALEATKKASETTAEQFAKLKNQFNVILSDIGAEFTPIVLDLFKELQDIMPELRSALTAIAKPLAELIGSLTRSLMPILESLLPLVEPLCDLLAQAGEILGAILPPAIDLCVKAIEPLLNGIESITKWVTSFINLEKKAFTDLKNYITGAQKDIDKASMSGGMIFSEEEIARAEKLRREVIDTYKEQIKGSQASLEVMQELLGIQEEIDFKAKNFKFLGGDFTYDKEMNDLNKSLQDAYEKLIALGYPMERLAEIEQAGVEAIRENIIDLQKKRDEARAESLKKIKDYYNSQDKKLQEYLSQEMNLSKEQVQSLEQLDDEKAEALISNWDKIQKRAKIFYDQQKEFEQDFKRAWEEIQNLLGIQMTEAFDRLGQSIIEGKNAWSGYASTATKELAKVLKSLGEELAILAVKAAIQGNWVLAGIAVAGAVAAGVSSGILSSMANTKELKDQTSKAQKEKIKELEKEISELEDDKRQLNKEGEKRLARLKEELELARQGKDYDEVHKNDSYFTDSKTGEQYVTLKQGEYETELKKQYNIGDAQGYTRGLKDGYLEAMSGATLDASLSGALNIAPPNLLNSTNIANNMNVVLEVDGQQLAYTNIKYMDDVASYSVAGA